MPLTTKELEATTGGLYDNKTGNQGFDWQELLKGINSPVMAAIIGLLGQQINKQNAADTVTPKQGINWAQTQQNKAQSSLDASLRGETTNPEIPAMREAIKARANQTFDPGTMIKNAYGADAPGATGVTPPKRYNPYQNEAGEATGYGEPNQTLMNKLLGQMNMTTDLQGNPLNTGGAGTDQKAAMNTGVINDVNRYSQQTQKQQQDWQAMLALLKKQYGI